MLTCMSMQPVVSVGNVSQLAADLHIENLGLEQIGLFDSRDLIPVVGPREKGLGITTPLERTPYLRDSVSMYTDYNIVYGKDGTEVVVIQQRSPVLKASNNNVKINCNIKLMLSIAVS